MAVLHVIGGGLAGLSAAVEATGAAQVRVYESSKVCGGRARSYYDKALERQIDNGNHLILSANQATFRYLGLTGALDELSGPGAPIFPWFDVGNGQSWTVKLNPGRFPFWVFMPRRRVPGMRLRDLRAMWRVLRCGDADVVRDCLGQDPLSRSLLAPFAVAALNTPCEVGSAKLLKQVMQACLFKGGGACIPFYPKNGLSETFVTPAEAHLKRMNAIVQTNCRVTGLRVSGNRISGLEVGAQTIDVSGQDKVILATPAPITRTLLAPHWADLSAPDAFESIINMHFALAGNFTFKGDIGRAGFTGVNGGITEWIYVKPSVLSVTISAANRYLVVAQDKLTRQVWREVRQAIQPVANRDLPVEPPAARIIIEKRATFAATPAQDQLRPGSATPYENLALAGDWVQTGYPSTLEGAICSGVNALRHLDSQALG